MKLYVRIRLSEILPHDVYYKVHYKSHWIFYCLVFDLILPKWVLLNSCCPTPKLSNSEKKNTLINFKNAWLSFSSLRNLCYIIKYINLVSITNLRHLPYFNTFCKKIKSLNHLHYWLFETVEVLLYIYTMYVYIQMHKVLYYISSICTAVCKEATKITCPKIIIFL